MKNRKVRNRAATTKPTKVRDLTVTKTGHVKRGSKLDRRITLFLVPPTELVAK